MDAAASLGHERIARERLDAPVRGGVGAAAFGLLACTLLAGGWLLREEAYLRADSGPGYVLGPVGCAAMLLLLLYSVRKRRRAWRSLGPVRYWLQVHMVLGVLGPIAILFHSNFRLGSTNSTVALVTMLIVASSGLIGRYIYGKIHYGLYGRRVDLDDARRETTEESSLLGPLLQPYPAVVERLHRLEERFSSTPRSSLHAFWRFAVAGVSARRTRALCLAELGSDRELEQAAVRVYTDSIRRVARFDGYERIFRLWHALHVPLFVMLLATAVAHVVAVHMY